MRLKVTLISDYYQQVRYSICASVGASDDLRAPWEPLPQSQGEVYLSTLFRMLIIMTVLFV